MHTSLEGHRPLTEVTVIGAGLAGCEAALQLASRGAPVVLWEMRPHLTSPAHSTGLFAELVCSNSFKSLDPSSATGSLKTELGLLGSFLLRIAHAASIPAGGALAVDRYRFANLVTKTVEAHPSIRVVRDECIVVPDGHSIIATGPLTSESMANSLFELTGTKGLSFYDAAAPVIDTLTVDTDIAFLQSRYDKGTGADYLNCPMDRDEYEHFISALVGAKRVVHKNFETSELFAGCQPVEEIARKGADSLRFGPMKPVGLTDPRTGRRPWAVVQLRPENASRTAFNMVGFQTNLTFSEQRRVFSLIPGLKDAEFLRYGVMHRNTFVNSPVMLDTTLSLHARPGVRIAGQLNGTEGYLESIAGGVIAGLNCFCAIKELPSLVLPVTSALGSLIAYITNPQTQEFQPMNVNWGLVPELDERVRSKRLRYEAYATRAKNSVSSTLSRHPLFEG